LCYSAMKEFHLSEEEMNQLAERYETPFLVASATQVEANYRFMRQHMPHVGIYYAMKANPTPQILQHVAALGSCFDVASAGEMAQLAALGVSGDRMIYANPVKDRRGLREAAALGVHRMTFDDASEIAKMAKYVPGADVLVRIAVRNNKALVDLNTKFGAQPEEALALLQQAKAAGLNPMGICFHVGSQSLSTAAYEEALILCRGLFQQAAEQGMVLTDLDIGGGFPVPAREGLGVDVGAMMDTIDREVARLFPETAVWCEPGRFMCGNAMNLVTTVIGTKERQGKPWYILDEGVYGALSGIIFDHWSYPLHCFGAGERRTATFAGPSCDGIDVLYRDVEVPAQQLGDHVLITEIGSYSTVSATRFNGFSLAPVLLWEDLPESRERSEREAQATREAVQLAEEEVV